MVGGWTRKREGVGKGGGREREKDRETETEAEREREREDLFELVLLRRGIPMKPAPRGGPQSGPAETTSHLISQKLSLKMF